MIWPPTPPPELPEITTKRRNRPSASNGVNKPVGELSNEGHQDANDRAQKAPPPHDTARATTPRGYEKTSLTDPKSHPQKLAVFIHVHSKTCVFTRDTIGLNSSSNHV